MDTSYCLAYTAICLTKWPDVDHKIDQSEGQGGQSNGEEVKIRKMTEPPRTPNALRAPKSLTRNREK